MNCDEYRAAFLAGELNSSHEAHFAGCSACRAEAGWLHQLTGWLNEPAVWEEPSPALREAVAAGVQLRVRPRSRLGRRWRDGAIGAAAVLVVLAAIGAWSLLRSPAPDWEAELVGTERMATARGTVSGWNSESGVRVRLDLEGLEAAPIGFVYELWFSSQDRHISAGTFVAGDGIELWTGVRRVQFPRLWVTLEALDANPAPSGFTVLDTPGTGAHPDGWTPSVWFG